MIRAGGVSALIRVVTVFLGFVVVIVLVRMLGSENFGRYSILFAVLTLAMVPATSGLATFVVRQVGADKYASAVVNWSLKALVLYIITVFSVATAGVAAKAYWYQSYENEISILIASTFIGFGMGTAAIFAAALRGSGRLIAGLSLDNVGRPFLLVILIGFCIGAQYDNISLTHALVFHAIAALTIGLLGWGYWHTIARSSPYAGDVGKSTRKLWLSSAMTLGFVTSLQLVNSQVDLLVLGAFHYPVEAGVYRVTVQLSSLVVFGLFALNQVLHPRFAKLWSENKTAELRALVDSSGWLIFLGALVPAIVLIAFGPNLLGTLFGPEFIDGYPVLLVLIIGQLCNAMFGSVGALLNMTGHEGDTVRGMAVALGANTLLSLILVPTHGALGAAISSAVSYFVWNTMLWRSVRIRLGINTLVFQNGRFSRRNTR